MKYGRLERGPVFIPGTRFARGGGTRIYTGDEVYSRWWDPYLYRERGLLEVVGPVFIPGTRFARGGGTRIYTGDEVCSRWWDQWDKINYIF